eukprot:TRINITY_DN15119_c0_g1_i1.p1 TRINITY_DN15119_c0_g1~~TRINITY_DN15119_c0_g1_i1.p1  ORF type:complete len:311 (+),score=83.29 TRINITY_DN15119_c0_g1_i1:61-993(+)
MVVRGPDPRDPDTIKWVKQAALPQLLDRFARELLRERPDAPMRFLRELLESDMAAKEQGTIQAEPTVPMEPFQSRESEAETARPSDASGEDETSAPLVGDTQFCYIVRHGHRIDDAVKDWTSDRPYDPPLTDEGKQAAEDLGKEFSQFSDEEKPTLIVCSPFTRCLETAAGVAKGLGLRSVRVHHQLGEIHDPRVLKDNRVPELVIPASLDGVDFEEMASAKPPFPESREAAMMRYSAAFDTVPAQWKENVVLVTHGEAVGRSIQSLEPSFTVFETPYCCYAVRFRSRDGGRRWTLKTETEGKVQWGVFD